MSSPEHSHVTHLVLTGGPGAGKSTALTYLTDQLTARGWRVLTVPEAATLLMANGVGSLAALGQSDRVAYLGVQHHLVDLQRDLRDRFEALAAVVGDRKTVVLHDRGIADNAAYMTQAEYRDVLAQLDLTPATAHALYDTVVHLRSAAVRSHGYDGSAYTTTNNQTRSEDADRAATLDAATLAGWVSHPHLVIVGSTGSFDAKLERLLAAVLQALGDPAPLEVERKFALRGPVDLTHPALAAAAKVDIEQVYLPAAGTGEERVRARTVAGETTFCRTRKVDVGDGVRVEVETPLTEQAYRSIAARRDPDTDVVRKTRYVFVVGDQRFELDHVTAPRDVWMLEAELVGLDDPLTLPDFLPEAVEVTCDRRWRNRALAARAS